LPVIPVTCHFFFPKVNISFISYFIISSIYTSWFPPHEMLQMKRGKLGEARYLCWFNKKNLCRLFISRVILVDIFRDISASFFGENPCDCCLHAESYGLVKNQQVKILPTLHQTSCVILLWLLDLKDTFGMF
jgi:hypothetical protein